MQKEKKKIICIMGKSGTGKSTVINDLVNLYPESFYAVKSYTTREPRENDPEDLKTHEFVGMTEYLYDEMLDKIISLYKSDKGYFSWTNEKSFDDKKINLYAIDPKACIELIKKYSDKYIIIPIYLYLNDHERFIRLAKRDNILELPEEKHLDFRILSKEIMYQMINVMGDRLNNTIKLLDEVTRWLVFKDGLDF